jgi:hypothetical protein
MLWGVWSNNRRALESHKEKEPKRKYFVPLQSKTINLLRTAEQAID